MKKLFYKQHLLWPLLIFITVAYIFEVYQLDLLIADLFYMLEGFHWSLRYSYLTKQVLHDGAQNFSKLLGVLFLLLAISSHFIQRFVPYKRGLWLLFLSFSTSAAIVAIGKSITHVDCPWDIQRYGGTRPYLSIFDAHPGGFKFGSCFPSGHASGGYGLLGLYFFFFHYKPEWRWLGLGASLTMGLIYGFTQQLRGGHFFSHDLWTLIICWLIALLFYCLLLKNRQFSFVSDKIKH